MQTQINQKNSRDLYLMQKIMSASSEQLISYVYDVAITACNKKDKIKAQVAVRELIKALNFDYKEISVVFYQVYQYINHLISIEKFEQSKQALVDLKKTWCTAMKVI